MKAHGSAAPGAGVMGLQQLPQPRRLDADNGIGLRIEGVAAIQGERRDRVGLELVAPAGQRLLDDKLQELRGIPVFFEFGQAQKPPQGAFNFIAIKISPLDFAHRDKSPMVDRNKSRPQEIHGPPLASRWIRLRTGRRYNRSWPGRSHFDKG